MRQITFLILFVWGILGAAQVAQQPEDISPVLIGETLPESSLINFEGKEITTQDIFKGDRTILVVYRGGWCPFCNAQLSDLGAIQQELVDLGYQIIAVSPDSYQNEAETLHKNALNYSLYSDNSTNFIQKLGIAFQAPEKYSTMLLKSSGGENQNVIPVPSVFIIDENQTILFEYISPDYKNRIDGSLLLAAAKHYMKIHNQTSNR